MSGSALELRQVSHRYGSLEALSEVSLSVAPGELVCLLGPSGCGKTTALRLAAGLEELQEGEIEIAGKAVARPGRQDPPEARGVGLVFQDFALFPHLDVSDNVVFGLRGAGAAERHARAAEMLRQVQLSDHAKAFPHTLSGGQQQRVALARALAPQPRVMLLDEPFSGLDVTLRREVRDQTLHILQDSGVASVMVTHDPEEAMFMADRILLMRAGRIEQCGSPDELYSRPRNPFVASFFGEINAMRGVVEAGAVASPLGAIPAPGFAEGQAVEILVRSEGLLVGALAVAGSRRPVCTARVLAARLLGRTSLLHLAMAAGDAHMAGEELHLHARVPGRFLPEIDEHIPIAADPTMVFIFPLEEAS